MLRPRKIPTQARAQATVDALIEATARILIEEGAVGVNTNRVAAVAGVSVGSLYQYFPGKDALIMAVVEAHAARVVGVLGHAFMTAVDQPLPQAIEKLVGTIVDTHSEQPALHSAIVSHMLTLGIHHTAPMHARAVDVVASFLHSRHEDLAVPDCQTAAWMLVTTVMAAVHGQHLGVANDVDPEKVKRELSALIQRYLLAPSSTA